MANRKSTRQPTDRKLSAAKLASAGAVVEIAHGWHVASRTGQGSHLVTLESATPTSDRYACTCQDHTRRGVQCAHILAVILYQRASAHAARSASAGNVVADIAATVAKVTAARDEFTRRALLVLLAALSAERGNVALLEVA